VLDAPTGADPDGVADSDVRVDTYRASGPGGQHRNTSDSAVRVTHLPTGVVVCATESRSQRTNRAAALAELRRRLAARDSRLRTAERAAVRNTQTGGPERVEVAWTWNEQRGTVTEHAANAVHRMKNMTRGRW
jgi:peptide chain release factor 1